MTKPTKTKSLGQIAFAAWYGRGHNNRTNPTWEAIARAVEREVLRRFKRMK